MSDKVPNWKNELIGGGDDFIFFDDGGGGFDVAS